MFTPNKVDGMSPLHLAYGGGHLEILNLLFENGADFHVKSTYGEKLLHGAFSAAIWSCRSCRNKNGVTLLHNPCNGGHLDVAELHPEHGDFQALFTGCKPVIATTPIY